MAKKNLSEIDQAIAEGHHHALKGIGKLATAEEVAALLAAFEAAPLLQGGMIDAGAAFTDAFVRLGHPPAKARELAAAALAAPADWRALLN